jgi:hypothetical protein
MMKIDNDNDNDDDNDDDDQHLFPFLLSTFCAIKMYMYPFFYGSYFVLQRCPFSYDSLRYRDAQAF